MVRGAGRNALQSCLALAIDSDYRACCATLFEAGMQTGAAMSYAVERDNRPFCKWLVRDCQTDPFVVQDHKEACMVMSPSRASAQKENLAIFEQFLGLWNTRSVILEQDGKEDVLDVFDVTLSCHFQP